MSARVVVLISGAGTNLQALLDAAADPAYGAQIVGVGSDRADAALWRGADVGIPTFVSPLAPGTDRGAWDRALGEEVAGFAPDLVVLAGFMKLLGPDFLARFPHQVVNTHPALCPAFPGVSAPADALAYGVKVTGATLFVVDGGVDTGPILAQVAVPVEEGDDVAGLHERIKRAEREMLVETVGRLAREGFTVEDRKVRIG